MKRTWILGLLLIFVFVSQAQAKDVDTVEWLSSDYVGVGAVDMERFSKRKLYDDLMAFFLTDADTKQALTGLEAAGFDSKTDVKRIVVGVPADVERGAHIVFFEAKKHLEAYRPLLAHDKIDVRTHSEVEYFCTKRANECMTVFGNVLAVGSEGRLKSVIDVVKAGGKGDLKKNTALAAQIKSASKNKDSWFAYALNTKIRERLGKNDPIADLTEDGLGKVNAGDLKAGNLSIDFQKGLDVSAKSNLVSKQAAASVATYLTKLLTDAGNSEDVKSLGIDFLIKAVSASAKDSNVLVTIKLSAAEFDQVIDLTTGLVQSVPAVAPKKSAKPASKASGASSK
ncbi:MAG: hypothetical protein ACOX8U_09960 [Bradymonadia bacterium]|jgi:hypothetical protein